MYIYIVLLVVVILINTIILTMVLLTNELILLYAFIGNISYVEYEKNVREGFICFSLNNVNNDSWAAMWQRMTSIDKMEKKVFTMNFSFN